MQLNLGGGFCLVFTAGFSRLVYPPPKRSGIFLGYLSEYPNPGNCTVFHSHAVFGVTVDIGVDVL